eukprot:UN4325
MEDPEHVRCAPSWNTCTHVRRWLALSGTALAQRLLEPGRRTRRKVALPPKVRKRLHSSVSSTPLPTGGRASPSATTLHSKSSQIDEKNHSSWLRLRV